MAKAIAGFFRTRMEGEAAQNALLTNGFNREEVNFVAGSSSPHETPAVGPVESIGADSEAGADAFIGGVAGLALGTVALAIPGLGLLFAAGPLAAALGGLSIGAAAGGLIGLLKDHGITEEEAEFIAEGVRKGGALITVNGVSDKRAKQAREILDRFGAIDVEDLADEPQKGAGSRAERSLSSR